MNTEQIKIAPNNTKISALRSIFRYGTSRAYSILIIAALIYTLTVKLFHAIRYNIMSDYIGWVLSDIAFFLIVEVILALVCFRWQRKWVVRAATVSAAIICTWSVLNAGWLIRTGTQILPRVLLTIVRSPVNAFWMIGVNLAKMPVAAVLLLGPSAVALTFLFYALSRPRLPEYKRQKLMMRVMICLSLVLIIVIIRPFWILRRSPQAASAGMQFNSQIKAVLSLVVRDYSVPPNPRRRIPVRNEIAIEHNSQATQGNLVVVILEGVQYRYTSLSDDKLSSTPFMEELAEQGVEFTNTFTSLSHTTKALFSLLTGRYPSSSQDLSEAVPARRTYASIATILSDKLGYRTAFFQSAKGDFECRPGLVYNLGFQKFWSRDDLNDPNSYIGYLGSDEFSMLGPIKGWIQSGEGPFFLTVLCSVTHDPYEVPAWYGMPAKEPINRYRQAISYTDKFLAALDIELTKMGLSDETIFCVVGDHGEAFGEHGQLGHARISFNEALKVPFCLRAPFLIEKARKVRNPVSSVDLTPTLLSLIGFDIGKAGFDGIDVLGPVAEDRKVYFTGWMREGPAGYVQGDRKYVYNPIEKATFVYDLNTDPREQYKLDLTGEQAERIAEDINSWRKNTVIKIDQNQSGTKKLFDKWVCEWTHRVSSAKHKPGNN